MHTLLLFAGAIGVCPLVFVSAVGSADRCGASGQVCGSSLLQMSSSTDRQALGHTDDDANDVEERTLSFSFWPFSDDGTVVPSDGKKVRAKSVNDTNNTRERSRNWSNASIVAGHASHPNRTDNASVNLSDTGEKVVKNASVRQANNASNQSGHASHPNRTDNASVNVSDTGEKVVKNASVRQANDASNQSGTSLHNASIPKQENCAGFKCYVAASGRPCLPGDVIANATRCKAAAELLSGYGFGGTVQSAERPLGCSLSHQKKESQFNTYGFGTLPSDSQDGIRAVCARCIQEQPTEQPQSRPTRQAISEDRAPQANVGAADGTPQSSAQANVGAADGTPQSSDQVNVGAADGTPESSVQANVGGADGPPQSSAQANVGAAVGAPQSSAQANVGAADGTPQSSDLMTDIRDWQEREYEDDDY